jgi:Uma2 family endonuclease
MSTLLEELVALTKTDHVSEAVYCHLAMRDDYALVELYRGQLREKPAMSVQHGDVMDDLLGQLYSQIDARNYRIRVQHARLRVSSATYFIPDIAIVPHAMTEFLRQQRPSLDAYSEPLPLVIEIWSPSTGTYDVTEKLAAYQERGDHEIWSVHPYARTLTSWVRQPDGAYEEVVRHSGLVAPSGVAGVTIDIGLLFSS